jgi:3-deoxy-D-manno-octulosonate 8-phosphate phosphatase (KDO 8-P phosphatase)
MRKILKKAEKIRLVIFDVDGVLTNGDLFIGDNNQEYKAFNSQDGLGIHLLQKTGVNVGIITARRSKVVIHRLISLGVKHIIQGKTNKLAALKKLCKKLNLNPKYIAYVGDDFIDLPVMLIVGLAIAVANAREIVKNNAHYCTQASGGKGAAREVCELIMQAQNNWSNSVKFFTQQKI